MTIVTVFDCDAIVIPNDTQEYENLLRQQLHRLIIKKMREAGWQTSYGPGVKVVKTAFLYALFHTHTSKLMEYPDLEKAITTLQATGVQPPQLPAFCVATMEQHKAIVRIGKYVLGAHYKDPQWYVGKITEWVTDYYNGVTDEGTGINLSIRRVTSPSQLTKTEAAYIIRCLEKVEFTLHRSGKIYTDKLYIKNTKRSQP